MAKKKYKPSSFGYSTQNEINFITNLGLGKFATTRSSRKKLLQNYLEVFDKRIWSLNVDPIKIKKFLDSEIAKEQSR